MSGEERDNKDLREEKLGHGCPGRNKEQRKEERKRKKGSEIKEKLQLLLQTTII